MTHRAGKAAELLLIALGVVVAVALFPWRTPSLAADNSPRAKDDASSRTTFRVAAIQAPSAFGEPETNRKHFAELARTAAKNGAAVIVLPETAITGYMSYDIKTTWRVGDARLSDGLTGRDPSAAAETVPGPSTDFFAPIAKELGVYLTVPLLEADRKTGRYYNTSVLLDPQGRIALHYRKLNPWLWAEKGWASEGTLGNPVIDTPYGRLGLLICFDIHKQAAVMSELKVDTLLYSIAWVDDKGSDWFELRLPDVAKRTNMNIVGANWSLPKGMGEKADWVGHGQSRVIAGNGKILAKAEEKFDDAIVYADLPMPGRQGVK